MKLLIAEAKQALVPTNCQAQMPVQKKWLDFWKLMLAWCFVEEVPTSPSIILPFIALIFRLGTTVKKTVLVAWMEGEEVKYKSLKRGQLAHDL